MEFTLSVVARAPTEAEAEGLALWSAHFLPSCLNWAARRAMAPPLEVVAAVREKRRASPDALAAATRLLLTAEPGRGRHVGRRDGARDAFAARLSRDVEAFRRWAAQASAAHRAWALRSASRDLHRVQAAIDRLRLGRIELVHARLLIVSVFVRATATLYVPAWMLDSAPACVLEPGGFFYRARPTSLTWLLFDAVAAPHPRFQTVMDCYGSRLREPEPSA